MCVMKLKPKRTEVQNRLSEMGWIHEDDILDYAVTYILNGKKSLPTC